MKAIATHLARHGGVDHAPGGLEVLGAPVPGVVDPQVAVLEVLDGGVELPQQPHLGGGGLVDGGRVRRQQAAGGLQVAEGPEAKLPMICAGMVCLVLLAYRRFYNAGAAAARAW